MLRFSIFGIFLILFVAALHFAKAFLIPVTVAFLFALVLSPVVRALKRHGIHQAISAILLVIMLALSLVGIAWSISGSVSRMVEDAPFIEHRLRDKLSELAKPIESVKDAEKSIQKATEEPPDPKVQEVVVREPGFLSRTVGRAPVMIASAGLSLVLLLFLLASGDLFYEKIVRAMPNTADKRRWIRIINGVEREVSRYLLAISTINVGVGVFIAVGLALVGFSAPILWGALAILLNFIPYVGPLVGILALGIVSLIEFPTLGQALLPPLIYAAANIIEGQFVMPVLVGRRLQINAVVIFLSIAFWGWLWGMMGILLAVPILIVLKTFAQHADGLAGLEHFLSARTPSDSAFNQEKTE